MASSNALFPHPEAGFDFPLFTSDVLSPLSDALHDVSALPRFIVGSLKTAFLFTKSDIKTILIPVTVFAVSTAPLHDRSHLPALIFWIWLHLLQCALANQSLGSEEDAINKPDRPIPSGRITVFQTKLLRWVNLPLCFALSARYSPAILYASVSLAVFLFIYNDLECNTHWLGRSLLNGAGLACFEVGATLIAGRDRHTIDSVSKLAIVVSTSIFISTVHAQDFKDELGDAKIGRRTLPMILPVASRVFTLATLLAWSIGLGYLWDAPPLVTGAIFALGAVAGVRFVLLKSVSDDQKTFYLYNVWLTAANALPALTARALFWSYQL